MKRRLILSSIISVIITVLLCVINWINVAITGDIWGIDFGGGECAQWIGFGVEKYQYFPIYHQDNPIETWPEYSFEPISLIATFIFVFLITFLVHLFVTRILINREKDKI